LTVTTTNYSDRIHVNTMSELCLFVGCDGVLSDKMTIYD
jgi:hypothetical protein